jgi:vancomycin resistance protein YoaR
VQRRSRYSYAVVAVLAGLVGLAFLALRDARSLDGRVMRRVTVNGRNVGGTSVATLDSVFADVQTDLETLAIRVATPDGGFSTTGEAIGIRVDTAELKRRTLLANRPENFGGRLKGYFKSWYSTVDVPVPVTISIPDTVSVLQLTEGTRRRDPVDPQLKIRKGKYLVLPGSNGEGIDAKRLADAIVAAIEAGERPPMVSARRVPLPSTFTTEELEALANKATQLTANPLTFSVDGKPGEISPAQLREWLKPAIVDRQVQLTLDETKTLRGLRSSIGSTIRPVQNARLAVNAAGEVEPVKSQSGLRCCSAETVADLQRAFNGSLPQPVAIKLEEIAPEVTTEEITSIGVKKPIATFTTRHKAGEARVKNIHRISDLTRGVVIKPGESFSVNDFVGDRTAAKGFVEARSIADGVLVDTYGGGISQYATTLFNAAFFAGLDIPKYKPHSIYIKRYPYGREATLSYPYVDLVLRNNTPYGVMIWPTYTASSITVALYSTEWAKSDVIGQTKKDKDQCTDVFTTRLRIFPNGDEKKDVFKARYLPGEGVSCDGSPTAGVSTTAPARTTTRAPRRTTVATPEPDSGNTDSGGSEGGSGDSDSGGSEGSGNSGSNSGGSSKPSTKKRSTKPAPVQAGNPAPAPSPEPSPSPAPTPPAPAPKPEPAPAPEPPPTQPPGPVEVGQPVTVVS